jgi:hypothetical protein
MKSIWLDLPPLLYVTSLFASFLKCIDQCHILCYHKF